MIIRAALAILRRIMAPRRRIAYREYLASPHWQTKREAYWRYRATKGPPSCESCGATDRPLDLHHNHYRTVGDERYGDLTPLCRDCHDDVHRIARWPGQTLESALRMVKLRNLRRG